MRRRLLLAAAAMAPWLGAAQAQTRARPGKPLRLVVAFPPGGLADVLARLLQAPLSRALGVPLVIDNRGGASGNLAAAEVVRSAADLHTLLVTTSTTETVNPLLFDRMPADLRTDLQPAGLLANSQLFLIVRPGLGVSSVAELVALARARPGRLSYALAGTATTPHLAGELFKKAAGIYATHIPYRGMAPAIQDVMGGQVDFAFAPGTAFTYERDRRLKVLAVAARTRAGAAPAVPTLEELGWRGVFADTLFGIYAPTALPAADVARFNQALNAQLAQPEIAARYAELGAECLPLTPAAYVARVREEAALFGQIVRERGIRAE